jgi:hypothetical protein
MGREFCRKVYTASLSPRASRADPSIASRFARPRRARADDAALARAPRRSFCARHKRSGCLISADLPASFSPTSPTTQPRGTTKDTSSSAASRGGCAPILTSRKTGRISTCWLLESMASTDRADMSKKIRYFDTLCRFVDRIDVSGGSSRRARRVRTWHFARIASNRCPPYAPFVAVELVPSPKRAPAGVAKITQRGHVAVADLIHVRERRYRTRHAGFPQQVQHGVG